MLKTHLRLLSLTLAATTCALTAPSAWTQSPAAVAAAPAVPVVTAARLDSSWVFPMQEAAAQVLGRNVSRLSVEVGGTLQRWTADVGAQVRRGQTLAQIDPRDRALDVQKTRAALDASQARLRLARAQLQRSRELTEKGFFSPDALAQRETEVELLQAESDAAQAQLATAQRLLDKTVLRAPFDGEIVERTAQTGETVAPGTQLFVLAESGPVELEAALDSRSAASLGQGRNLQFKGPAQGVPVTLQRLGTTVSAPARTRTARLSFNDRTQAPAPGTSGTLHWEDSRAHLPPQLLVRRQGQLGVFLLGSEGAQTVARFQAIAGAQEGRAVPMPAGWAPASRVVIRGQSALQDGQQVSVNQRDRQGD
ncbi:MAG: efflux RND transporter periplasmic adaptor subunit [Burkholderiaceae bacterium]